MQKLFIPFFVFVAACTPYADVRSPDRINIELEGKSYTLVTPTGYCFDRPTLQKRQGWIDPDLVVVEVIASNCIIKNGQGIPTTLTNVLTYGLSPSESSIEDQAKEIKEILKIDGKFVQDNFQFVTQNDQLPALNYLAKINDAVLLLRVTNLTGDAKSSSQDLLVRAVSVTRQAN